MQQSETEGRSSPIDLALYDRYSRLILAYLCQHIANVQDAEDLLVEVFLAALNKPGFASLVAEHQIAWLRRVAHNKMVDYLRREKRLTLVSLEEAQESESTELTPEQYSMRRENYALLYQSLAHLSAEQQELIRLRYGEGLRLIEIAAHLQKPDGTVRKQFLRAIRNLRKFYNQSAGEREN